MNDKMLNTLLKTPEVYRRIISKIISNDYIIDDIILIDNLQKYIIENRNELPKKELNNYTSFIYDLIDVDSNNIFKFNILKQLELFSESKQILIKDKQIKVANKVFKLSNKLLNNEKVSNKDMNLILDFFNYNVDNISLTNYLDNIYKYILNNYKGEYQISLINYTSRIVCDYYKIPYTKIYFNNDPFNSELTINDKNNYKYINKITNNIYSIIKLIRLKKELTPLEEFNNIRNIILKKYLDQEEYNNYLNNYKNEKINYYIEEEIWRLVIFILKKYSSCLYEELNNTKKDTLVKYYYRSLYISNPKVLNKEKYIVDKLDTIVSSNPNLVNVYPLLNKIYDDKGNKLSIIKILKNEQQLNEKNIFNDYIVEYIQVGNLIKLDINILNEEEQYLLISKINNLLKIEINEENNLLKIYNLLNQDDIHMIERKKELDTYNFNRVNKIKYYINYLNDNKNIIDNINSYNINKEIKNTIKSLNNLKNNINNTYNTNIVSLKEVDLYE